MISFCVNMKIHSVVYDLGFTVIRICYELIDVKN